MLTKKHINLSSSLSFGDWVRMRCFAFLSAVLLLFITSTVSAQVYSTTGQQTWTCPTGVTTITIQCWGGGGGGGGGGGDNGDSSDGAGGGGGGAYSASTLTVTPGQTYTLYVGAGGSGGTTTPTDGGDGTDSWFSLNGITPTSIANGVLAKGGLGGKKNTSGGAGGAGSLGGQSSSGYGTIATYSGGSGGTGRDDAAGKGGGGGASAGTSNNGANGTDGTGTSGVGGNGSNGGANGGNSNYSDVGSSGSAPGGGGAGAGENFKGGHGGDGWVAISYDGVYSVGGTYTWVAPASITTVTVECWGGGGGGGGGDELYAGGGGGGGAYSKKVVTVNPGSPYTVSVGAFGVGGRSSGTGADGTSGGDSWFVNSTTILAKGGSFGNGSNGNGGNGGASTSCVGTTTVSGGKGSNPIGGGEGDGGGGGEAGGSTQVGKTSTTITGASGNNADGGDGGNGNAHGNNLGYSGVPPGGGGGGGGSGVGDWGSDGYNGGCGYVVLTYPRFSASIDNSNQTICSGSSPATLTVTPTGGAGAGTYGYTWQVSTTSSTSGFATASGTATNSVYAPGTITVSTSPVTYYYNCVVTSTGFTAVTTTAVSVLVNPSPVLSSTLTPAGICSGTTFSYTATSATSGATFSWSRAAVTGITQAATTGTGNVSEVLTNTTTAAINVTYVYTTSANNCTGANQNVIVTVNPLPILSSTLTPSTICSASAFTYTATSATSGATFAWSRAAITGITQAASSGTGNVSEVLTNTTTATINVTYVYTTTAAGCSGSSQNVIVGVAAQPTASAGGSQTICSSATATVSGASSSAGTIAWTENGAGSITSGATTLTPVYTAAAGDGGNTVTLTMTVSNSPCTSATATYSVYVKAIPTASAGGSQTICTNGTAVVSGASSSNGTILWTHNGSGALSNATTLTPTYTPAVADGGNVVTLTMTVSNTPCASATAVYTVTVNPLPTSVTATASPNPVCEGNTLTLTGSATNATSWSWAGPNSFTSSSQNPTISSITSSAGGTYTLTATNACGSATPVTTSAVTVAQLPTGLSASASPNSLPSGYGLTLYGYATNATGYSWSGPNSFTSSSSSPTLTAVSASAGTYTLSANNLGCTAITTAVVTITVTSSDQTICQGNSPTDLTGSAPTGGNGSYTYQWEQSTTGSASGFTNATGTSTGIDYSPGAITTTTWYRRITSSSGCSDNSEPVKITVVPVLTATLSSSQTICSGISAATLSITAGGGDGSYTYMWESSTTASDSGFSTLSSETSSTYAPGAITTNTYFRATTNSGTSCTGVVKVVLISVIPPVSGNGIAASQTICSGTTPNVLTESVAPSGGGVSYTYSWESSITDSLSGFSTASGTATASTYTPGAISATTWYRRLVSTTLCSGAASDTSNVVEITYSPALQGNVIASAQTICNGSSANALQESTVTTGGGNSGYSFIWESSTTGSASGFSSAPGTNTDNAYFPGAITVDTWYRRVVSSGDCFGSQALTSNAVEIVVQTVLTGNVVGGDQTICSGASPATLTVTTAPSGGSGTFSYQWQESTDNSTYADISGATGSTYSPGTLTATTYYKRAVTSGACTHTSSAVTITVDPAIANNTISAAQTICNGVVPAQLSGSSPTGGNGATYTYLWETSPDNVSYSNASGTNNTQDYSPGALTADTWYRRVVTSAPCSGSTGNTSSAIKITVTQNSSTLAIWNGNTSTDWFDATNWCAILPSATVSALIPAGTPNSPVIAGNGANCYNITIDPSATVIANTTYSLGIYGNWTNNGTFTTNSGAVHFKGSGNQSITGSGTQSFYNLVINNTGASGSDNITLSKPVTVTNSLTLTDGLLVTSSTNLLTLTNSSTSATTGGNSTGPSFVKGPMRWNGLTGAGPWIFPTGKGTNKWARVAVSDVTSATDFTCEYFNNSYTNVSSADLATTPTPTLIVVSNHEYWNVDRTSGTGNAAVTLYWENAAASGITSCTDLLVAHYPLGGSNKWENQGNAGTTGSCTGNGSGSIKGTVQTSFSPETFGDAAPDVNPLPIELLYFDATYNGKSTDIKWATATEINSDYFTIERSTDGIHFYSIAVVPSLAEGGNSTSTLYYTYVDLNYEPGTYYYRIKQTDFDGQFQYTSVKAITIKGYSGFSFEVAPNPNNGSQITILINALKNETITLNIYDMLGQIVYTNKYNTTEDGNNVFPLQIQEKLSAGVYIFTATPSDENQAESKKVIVE